MPCVAVLPQCPQVGRNCGICKNDIIRRDEEKRNFKDDGISALEMLFLFFYF